MAGRNVWRAPSLAFRDWLRTHEDDRCLYEGTKKRLAARTWTYTRHDADAKSDVVQQILQRALARGPSTAPGGGKEGTPRCP